MIDFDIFEKYILNLLRLILFAYEKTSVIFLCRSDVTFLRQ